MKLKKCVGGVAMALALCAEAGAQNVKLSAVLEVPHDQVTISEVIRQLPNCMPLDIAGERSGRLRLESLQITPRRDIFETDRIWGHTTWWAEFDVYTVHVVTEANQESRVTRRFQNCRMTGRRLEALIPSHRFTGRGMQRASE